MPKKQYNAEEIIQKLRGADVLLGRGKTVTCLGRIGCIFGNVR